MLDSLYIGASGMYAQQTDINVVANNLANVNTAGFKKNRVNFEDLLYHNIARSNGLIGSQGNNYRLGAGASIASTDKVFTVGDLKKTDQPLDLGIRGQGFFEVTLPDGSLGYTRNGALQINTQGALTTADGYPLSANIQIPTDATNITIDPTGIVTATEPNQTSPVQLGQIEVATFVNPAGLQAQGSNIYIPTANSGVATLNQPSQNGTGSIAQGYLEGSNVNLVNEMVNLIMAQRAYEMNSKVVQASDQMLSISNGLYRG